jgi:hypothetical protein
MRRRDFPWPTWGSFTGWCAAIRTGRRCWARPRARRRGRSV